MQFNATQFLDNLIKKKLIIFQHILPKDKINLNFKTCDF